MNDINKHHVMAGPSVIKLPVVGVKLNEIFDYQQELMEKIYAEHNIKIAEPKVRQKILSDLITSIMVESGELLNETKVHKHWSTAPKVFDENFRNREKVEEELIDVWLFLVEATILLDIDANTVMQRYKKKVGICETRIKEGY